MVGTAVVGVVTTVAWEVKVAVLSRIRFAAGSAVPSAVKVTAPEGAPAMAEGCPPPALCANCAVSTVCPEVVTGVGVAVMVPELGVRATMVRVIGTAGALQKDVPPAPVLQTLKAAVVPAGEDENAAGTATLIELGVSN